MPDRKLCIAPVLDHTGRYCGYFPCLISRHTLLYVFGPASAPVWEPDSTRLI